MSINCIWHEIRVMFVRLSKQHPHDVPIYFTHKNLFFIKTKAKDFSKSFKHFQSDLLFFQYLYHDFHYEPNSKNTSQERTLLISKQFQTKVTPNFHIVLIIFPLKLFSLDFLCPIWTHSCHMFYTLCCSLLLNQSWTIVEYSSPFSAFPSFKDLN